ncbi:MAG: hypothetical protein RLZZ546_1683 [Bacteroidota bacterium]|jgi:hypothetical protein
MGKERAEYGSNLVDSLSKKINKKGLSSRSLRQYRQFYLFYPSLIGDFNIIDNLSSQIWQSATAKLQLIELQYIKIWQSATAKSLNSIIESENNDLKVPSEKLLANLSYTHIQYCSQ